MHPLEKRFLGLRGAQWRETSPQNERYNCVAWACDDTERWWWPWPEGDPPGYWPGDGSADDSLASALAMFEARGYTRCEPETAGTHDDVVVLYDAAGRLRHVARRAASGWWASKLGALNDIEHQTLDAIAGPQCGSPRVWMRRAPQ
jgi:hypothetical protein